MSSIPLTRGPLKGRFVTLNELEERNAEDLWDGLGLPATEWLWNYLIKVPPSNPQELWDQFKPCPGVITYAIWGNPDHLNHRIDQATANGTSEAPSIQYNQILGVIGYLNINPTHRALDIGSVVLSPTLQRTVAATEATYLLLRHVFDDLGKEACPLFRRVMWKFNSLNENSRRAAQRFGFIYEGTLRKHMVVKGKFINSDWHSIVEDEWQGVKAALEAWMDVGNFDGDGRQLKSLDEIRTHPVIDS